MDFKGWIRTSLIEYPEHIASVLFCSGCDFRCPMCHNAHLLIESNTPAIEPEQVAEFVARRRGLVDGIVISGGEPTSQPGLISFLQQARSWQIDIKLDTNGYHPEVLQVLLNENLVDYIAMDIKAPPEKYPALTGVPSVDINRIEKSIALIRSSGLAYEFRTTVIPGSLSTEDVMKIAGWIQGAQCYLLQQFRPTSTLDPALQQLSPYPRQILYQMANAVKPFVELVRVRGVE